MAQRATPLSAFLEEHDKARAFGLKENAQALQEFGMLARLQEAAERRTALEQFKREQLSAQVEGQRAAISSREAMAEQARMAAIQRADAERALRGDIASNANTLKQQMADAQIAAGKERDANAAALRRELAAQDATLRRELAAGKKTEKEAALDDGKKTVSQIVGTLNAQYQELSKQGAIPDVSKGAVHNIQSSIASSTPGQLVGRVVGTQAQGIRNQINQTRPLLMNAIRQATGQSAKSLDSNIELKFYLQAATDPQLDIDSNLAALDHLDKLYGLGIGINAKPSAVTALKNRAPKVSTPAPEGVDPNVWGAMTPEEKALWQR